MGCEFNVKLHSVFFDILHVLSAPVQTAIRYHDVVYASGFREQVTRYQGGLSAEANQAWSELYPCKYIAILTYIPYHEALTLLSDHESNFRRGSGEAKKRNRSHPR
jgi:hypothetical protein